VTTGEPTYKCLLAHWKSNAARAMKLSPILLVNRIRIPSDPETGLIYRTDSIDDKGAYRWPRSTRSSAIRCS
jgi:hypothetical protein